MGFYAVNSIFIVLSMCCMGALTSCPSQTRINQLKEGIKSQMTTNNRRNIPLGVRLAFHDCVGEHGCDGCVDLENPENRGLERILELAHDFYVDGSWMINDLVRVTVEDKEKITYADWIALVGVAAVEQGILESRYDGQAQFDAFKCGRVTSRNCAGENNDNFPHGHNNFMKTMEFFKNEFGLSKRDGTILLGAHSLGRAARQNSGFNGPWTNNEEELDNAYYDLLRREEWMQADVNMNEPNFTAHYQWRVIRAPRGPPPMDGDQPPMDGDQPPMDGDQPPMDGDPPPMNGNPPQARKKRATADNQILQRVKRQGPGGRGPNEIMLNADMALYKDIIVDDHGIANCSNSSMECEPSETAGYVEELAADNNLFVREFIRVFTIMIEKGLDSSNENTGEECDEGIPPYFCSDSGASALTQYFIMLLLPCFIIYFY